MSDFPLPLYLSSIAILYFLWQALWASDEAWGLPSAAVLVTAAAWYVGDAIYNDYTEFSKLIGPEHLVSACWQLLGFVVSFGLMVKPIHQRLNRKLPRQRSFAVQAYKTNIIERESTQVQIDLLARGVIIVWVIVMGTGLWRVDGDFLGLFAPYISGVKADPWARGRVGEGLDALLSLAGYVQIFLTSAIGVIFALSNNPRTRMVTGFLLFLSAPYFIFDRIRNAMLASLLPGILAWVLLRLRAGFVVKAAMLGLAMLVINFWFSFVIANRTEQGIASAFAQGSGVSGKDAKHDGLNMLEELGWMNSFLVRGTYHVTWGQRYFADVVNPIPRALWPNKPAIGIDYAVARGFASDQASKKEGGIAASVADGMIGQGVAAFGRFLGPIATAVLLSLWVTLLARQDLQGWDDPARLLLYGSGMVLTFNMGRDITFLVVYPFFLGLILLWFWKFCQRRLFDGFAATSAVHRKRKRLGARPTMKVPRRRGGIVIDSEPTPSNPSP